MGGRYFGADEGQLIYNPNNNSPVSSSLCVLQTCRAFLIPLPFKTFPMSFDLIFFAI